MLRPRLRSSGGLPQWISDVACERSDMHYVHNSTHAKMVRALLTQQRKG